MRLGSLFSNVLVLAAFGWMMTFATAEENAAALLPRGVPNAARAAASADVTRLEADAAHDLSPAAVAALAGAYLDRDQPGLATAVLEKASDRVQSRPEVAQLYARALFHRGRPREALAAARHASNACDDDAGCPAWLAATTTRQVSFLEHVVAAGIDDPHADPEGTRAAYEHSAREVRLVAMR